MLAAREALHAHSSLRTAIRADGEVAIIKVVLCRAMVSKLEVSDLESLHCNFNVELRGASCLPATTCYKSQGKCSFSNSCNDFIA